MLRKLFKKISVITISLLLLQLMSFGLGLGTRSALAVDVTPPSLVSVTANLGGTFQTKLMGENLVANVGQSVGSLTATLDEVATLVGSTGAISISGGTIPIPSGTPYGTFTVSGTLVTINPNTGNNVLGQAGTFNFTVAADQIQDIAGNGNIETTFTLVVLTPLTTIGSISGTTQVGSTLTAGTLTPSGATASYPVSYTHLTLPTNREV